jgi:hypothetical protein
MKTDQEYQAKWLKLFNQYKISNQTMKAFCLIHNVKVYQLQYWLKKYKQRAKDNSISFTEVNVIKQPIVETSIRITSGKLVIEIPNNFNEGTLLKLLKVVDQLV